MVEVRISYETLFDILRREKQKEDLQELPNTFMDDLVSYISEKEAILRKGRGGEDHFLQKEQDNASVQLQNVKKLVRELFERRENKIIRLAQDKVRGGPVILTRLLADERRFFDELAIVVSRHRSGLHDEMGRNRPAKAMPDLANRPVIESRDEANGGVEKPGQAYEFAKSGNASSDNASLGIVLPLKDSSLVEELAKPNNMQQGHMKVESSPARKTVRFTNPLPRFLGKELEVYGPFKEDEEASLPAAIADLLVRKGRAVPASDMCAVTTKSF